MATESIITTTYRRPSEIPPHNLTQLRDDACASNVIRPRIESLLSQNQGMVATNGQFWISCSTGTRGSVQFPRLDFFLACTAGAFGNCPISIYSGRAVHELEEGFLDSRMSHLAAELFRETYVRRVFAVFAVEQVSRVFARWWQRYSTITILQEPYFAATYTFCDSANFRERALTPPVGYTYDIRLARNEDILQVARLCYSFSVIMPPYALSQQSAQQEAAYLIAQGHFWVLVVRRPNRADEIVSMVAVERECRRVSAITKVFTSYAWRGRGLAERLVRSVTWRLIFQKRKEFVVLYVAHANELASRVFSRVGFVGLGLSGTGTAPIPGVESWLEVGFDRTMVDMGRW